MIRASILCCVRYIHDNIPDYLKNLNHNRSTFILGILKSIYWYSYTLLLWYNQ